MARTLRASRERRRVAFLEALCRTVPYHIAERVLADPVESSVADETFDGSVIVVELVGFTGLCERLAHEVHDGLGTLSRLLNELFTRLLDDAVFPYDGYVVHFGGDSLTGFFRGDGHARRAIAAALGCRRIVEGDGRRLLVDREDQLALRVGLAAGTIEVPILGDFTRRVATFAGPTAERAQGLQEIAEPNTVLADRALVEAAGEGVQSAAHSDHGDDGAVRVIDLRDPPRRVAIAPLGDRVLDRVEEKIALLEPLVPQPLAGRMKSTPSGWRIVGELRSVVLLFAEVAGLARVSADARADLGKSLLRTYRKYGGIVAKVELAGAGHRVAGAGHRVMVVFGLHRPADNDAERALLAGLEASTRLKSYAASRELDVQLRTGVHAGRVYFGAIGSDYKHDITVVGDTVSIAARTAASAEPFEVVVTTPVRNAVQNEFEHSSRGTVWAKGRAEGVQMYVVHGPNEGRAHYVQARTRSRFCAGRQGELRRLDEAVDAALAGRGRILGLYGPAGSGKSFLLAPVIDRWSTRGGVGVLGRCRFATSSTPLAPVVAMLASFLGLTDGDSDEARRTLIRRGFEEYDLRGGAPELAALLMPVRRPDGVSEALVDLADPHARERVLASILELLGKRLEREPLLYVLEDLHFADTLTLELAQRLTSIGRHRPFLMLTTYRPDPLLNDLRRALDGEIGLGNLSLADATALVAYEMDAAEVDHDLAVFLWQRTAGRPGHLNEILRFLGERQLLERRDGMVVAPEPGIALLEDIVPRTIAQVALARLDDLGAVERRLLRMASAIGRRFAKDLLQGLLRDLAKDPAGDLRLDVDADWFESAVTRLTVQRVIVPSSHEHLGYMFRDGVTRAVTYGTIPADERRAIHARIADALERLEPGDGRRAASTLGLHRERAGQYAEAAVWYGRAARIALRTGLDRETAELVGRYRRCVELTPAAERPDPARQARMALLELVATARQGAPLQTVRVGRKLVAEHGQHLDAAARLVVDSWLGRALAAAGKPDQARARLERVWASDAQAPQRCDAARLIALTYLHAGDAGEARAWIERAAELAGDDEVRVLGVELLRGNLLENAGRIDRARAVFAEVKNRATAGDFMLLAARATADVATCDMLNGHFELAMRGFGDALVMHRALHDWSSEAHTLANLGQAYLWAKRPVAAREHLARALQRADELGDALTAAAALVHLGAAIAATEDPIEGTRVCESGRERAASSGLREAVMAADLHAVRLALLRRDEAAARRAIIECHAHGRALLAVPLYGRVLAELELESHAVGDGLEASPQESFADGSGGGGGANG